MKKYLFMLVFLLIFLGIGIIARFSAIANAPQLISVSKIHKTDGIPVSVISPVRKTLIRELKLLGSVLPWKRIAVSARLDERIVESNLKLGKKVTSGEVLVKLFDKEIMLQVETARGAVQQAKSTLDKLRSGARPQEIKQAQATLESAQAHFENAKKEFERMKVLIKENAITTQKAERITAEYESARAGLEAAKQAYQLVKEGARKEEIQAAEGALIQAEAALGRALLQLEYTQIRTPIDGYIAEYFKEVGENAERNKPIFVVVAIDKLYLIVDIPEKEIGLIQKGNYVKISADQLPDKVFEGTIDEISPDADPVSRTFVAKIIFVNNDLVLKPGMLANAYIKIREKPNSLVIPRDCLTTHKGKTGVFLVKDGQAVFRNIPVEAYRDELDVSDHLSENDQVIINGMKGLMGGEKLTIVGG